MARPTPPRLSRLLLTVLLTGGLGVLGAGQSASAAEDGQLRLAHLSPDTPPVDVYVDSVTSTGEGIVLDGVSYGAVSGYQSVPAGTYTVSMRSAGADPSTPPVLSTTVTLAGAEAKTVAGVGMFADLGLTVLDDDLTLPPAGQARARVVNAASTLSPADVALAGGTALAAGLPFADQTSYVVVTPGGPTLDVGLTDGTPTSLPVELAPGATYTVLLLDDDGQVTAQAVLDAAGPSVVPAGGVEAGGGGAADGDAAGTVPLVAGGVSVFALVLLLVTAGRRLPARTAAARHTAR